MAEILRSRELDFLHPVARTVGGPAVRSQATVGGNLFAETPYGDLDRSAPRAECARSASTAATAPASCRSPSCWRSATAACRGSSTQVTIDRPAQPGAFRFLQGQPRAAEGHLGALDRGLAADRGRAHPGCADRLRRDGADPDPGARGRARARGAGASIRPASRPALAVAADDCAPADDAIASAWYRREVLPVHLRRLLLGEAPMTQKARAVPAQRRGQGGVRRGRPEPARRAPARHRRLRAQVRLRPGHLRGLHRADRRRAAALPA